MRAVIFVVVLLGLAMPGAALAAPEDDLQAMRASAMALPGAVVTELPDLTMVVAGSNLAYYYFTKPGHYAHPGAVLREAVIQPDGAWVMRYTTWPYERPEKAPASFIQWMNEFAALDRAMREDILRNQPR